MIQSAMGKGPMLRYFDVSMITNPEFQEYALEIAKINKIPVQVSVRSGGGTNGMAITQVQGAPTIVVGILSVTLTHPIAMWTFKITKRRKELVIQLIKNLDADKIQALVQPLSKSGTNEDLCVMRY